MPIISEVVGADGIKEELPDDSELGFEDEIESQPSPLHNDPADGPADARNVLTSDEMEVRELLKSLGMENLFCVFKDECIYSRHLTKMTSPMILELLRPFCKIRTIVDFVNKLTQWKKNFARHDVACNTEPTEHTEQCQTPPPTVPDLKQIISDRNLALIGTDLTSTSRNWLVEVIASYFVHKKIDFTQAMRDGVAQQIAASFPNESPWYYSDDGLAHRGADRLYVTYRYKRSSQLQNTATEILIPPAQPVERPRVAILRTPAAHNRTPALRLVGTPAAPPQPVKVVPTGPTAMPPPAAVVIVPRNTLLDAPKQQPAPKTIKQMVQLRRASIAEERPRPQTTPGLEKAVPRVATSSGRYYVLHTVKGKAGVANGSVAPSGGPPLVKVARFESPRLAVDHKEVSPEVAAKEQDENSAPSQPVEGGEHPVNGEGKESDSPPVENVASIKGEFVKALTSCLELNKNILTRGFERQLKIVNRFRERAYCERFVEKFHGLLRKSKRFNIDGGGKKTFQDTSLSQRMTMALFLLPAVLNPKKRFHFSEELLSSFISVRPSVQEFVSSLRKGESSVPHVGIMGRIDAPLSYVVYYQRRVYRCAELWHAMDMAVKIFAVYRPQIAADCANAWQFVMLHFYGMEEEGQFVYPSVRTLQGVFSMD